jgi:lipid II:glycine glycyltransferase (peptidoglycan interpeptide bridge formation enzyme)
MNVRLVDNQHEWDEWLQINSEYTPFAQSWFWGDILIAEGKKVERLRIIEKDNILVQAQILYNELPFGWQYAFCEKGVIGNLKFEIRNFEIIKTIINYLKYNGCCFFRLEPADLSQFPISNFKFQKSFDITPRATLIVDLNKVEKDLLADMHAKTRYNIHLAHRKNLQIKDEKDIEVFLKFSRLTAKRDQFSLHPENHYRSILSSIFSVQLSALCGDEVIASNVFVGFGNTFTYLYGASDYQCRNLMAPYLLQWEGIKLGKKLGYRYYDFFGIAPANRLQTSDFRLQQDRDKDYTYDMKHQYAGVTRFKLGFGGQTHEDPGKFDIVLDKKKYFIYQMLRKIRRFF